MISGRSATIDFCGRITKTDRDFAMEILRQIGGAHLAERPWRVLSQGERQRVLIGRALMAQPRLLILDEPCAGLDPAAREHFLEFVERLGRAQSAPTLVLVTHHVQEITPGVFGCYVVVKRTCARVRRKSESSEGRFAFQNLRRVPSNSARARPLFVANFRLRAARHLIREPLE